MEVENFNQNDAELDPELLDFLIKSGQVKTAKDLKNRNHISAPVSQHPWPSVVWPALQTDQLHHTITVQGSEAEYRKQFTGEWLPEPETDDQES